MSDSIEYAKMSEIPVSSCEITVKPLKKKKDIKKKVIEKVNEQLESAVEIQPKRKKNLFSFFKRGNKAKSENVKKQKVKKPPKERKERGFDIVTAQLITIFALVVAILLTNIFWENSAMNTMLKHVFNKEKNITMNYNEFEAVSPTADRAVSIDNGVMTVSGKGSVYSPVAGKVTLVAQKDGKWEMTIEHTDEFKSVISGLDCCFYDKGYKIYSTTPIGFSEGSEVKVEMFNNGNLITDYSISNGCIVWG